MPAVRYLALAALVVWLGLTLAALGEQTMGGLLPHYHPIAAGSGAVMLAALFIMKFVGPPPRAFVVRAAIVFVMVAAAVSGWLARAPVTPLLVVNMAFGFILLFWYSHE
jgi:hypothetical protein